MAVFLAVCCGVLGLSVGSFLNVVIHRVPRKESVVRPRSACPSCHTTIRNRDNIPVLSWILLKGHCRDCRISISPRYALVEALTSALFVATVIRLGTDWAVPSFLALVAGLVALAFTDLENLLLPVRIVYPTVLAVVALQLVAVAAGDGAHHLVSAAASGAVAFVAFFALHVASPRGLGFGDVRLAGLIGLGLGWLGGSYAFIALFSGCALAALIGITLIASGRMGRKTPLPLGFFLAAGSFVALFAGQPLSSLMHRR